MTKRQIAAALATVLSLPVLLGGCAGVSDDTIKQSIHAAVIAQVPHATDAIVTLNYDGSPANRGVGIKVYLDRATPEDVETAVDMVLKLAWKNFPVEPVRVGVAVVDGPKTSTSTYSALDGVELHEAATALNIDDTGSQSLVIPQSTLESRYGPWESVSEK